MHIFRKYLLNERMSVHAAIQAWEQLSREQTEE